MTVTRYRDDVVGLLLHANCDTKRRGQALHSPSADLLLGWQGPYADDCVLIVFRSPLVRTCEEGNLCSLIFTRTARSKMAEHRASCAVHWDTSDADLLKPEGSVEQLGSLSQSTPRRPCDRHGSRPVLRYSRNGTDVLILTDLQ